MTTLAKIIGTCVAVSFITACGGSDEHAADNSKLTKESSGLWNFAKEKAVGDEAKLAAGLLDEAGSGDYRPNGRHLQKGSLVKFRARGNARTAAVQYVCLKAVDRIVRRGETTD